MNLCWIWKTETEGTMFVGGWPTAEIGAVFQLRFSALGLEMET